MGLRSLFARKKKQNNNNNNNINNNSNKALTPIISRVSSSTTAATRARAQQIEELKLVFNKFDANGDGKISSTELGSMMMNLGQPSTEEELRKMIIDADKDGDGFIDLNEFIELNTKDVDSSKVLESIRDAFLVFDMDRNGSISAEELHKVLKSLGESCSVAECRKMISGVDADGDGMIDFDEFKVMMMDTGSLFRGKDVVIPVKDE